MNEALVTEEIRFSPDILLNLTPFKLRRGSLQTSISHCRKDEISNTVERAVRYTNLDEGVSVRVSVDTEKQEPLSLLVITVVSV